MSGHAESKPTLFDMQEILKILPHRYPFLLVDKIVEMDLENDQIVGLKNVTMNEPFFQGHFPGVPIMPGVLILEALAQAGGILVHQKTKNDKTALLLNVNNAKFRKPVVPGDTLMLHADGIHVSNKAGKIRAKAVVDGKTVAEAEIGFVLMPKDQI